LIVFSSENIPPANSRQASMNIFDKIPFKIV